MRILEDQQDTAGQPPDPGEPFDATPEDMVRALALFKVLSHPDRLRLACALGDGRVTTQKELVEEFGWPQSTAARHITALRNTGLIVARRDGTEVLLKMGNPVTLHLLRVVCDWVHHPAPAGAAALYAVPGVTDTASRLKPTPPLSVGNGSEEVLAVEDTSS